MVKHMKLLPIYWTGPLLENWKQKVLRLLGVLDEENENLSPVLIFHRPPFFIKSLQWCHQDGKFQKPMNDPWQLGGNETEFLLKMSR